MTKKYELITKLYNKTLRDVFSNTQDWMAFLRSACYNYRLPFDDLLLIYAQRPDATAVLPIKGANGWNRLFKRWVNRGSTGIAVFDHAYTQGIRLKYYFDISDTHESEFSPPVPLWTATQEDIADITETLENRFGALADKSDLAQTLLSAAQNAVEDNHADYLSELLRIYEDTDLVWLDRSDVETTYKMLLQNSVGYLLLTRCGADANAHFSADSFKELPRFNTPEAMHCLGVAARDIAETLLMPIARTVRGREQPEKKNRTFAQNRPVRYAEHNEEKQQPAERRNEHGTDVHDAGRVPSAEPDRAGAAGGNTWEVRVTAADVSERASQGTLHDAADQRTADSAPYGDRAGGAEPDGADRDTSGESRKRDGGAESPRPDEMGGPDEQLPAIGGGNHPGGTDLQLTPQEPEPRANGDWPAEGVPAVQLTPTEPRQETVDDPATEKAPMPILPSVAEQQKAIERAGAQNAPAFSMAEKEPTQVSFEAVLENGGYDTDGQLSFMPRPKISQDVIDEALRAGANDPSSRLVICARLMKNHADTENAAYFAKHYGTNGAGFFVSDRKYALWYDGTGMFINSGESARRPGALLLSWVDVARRIRELWAMGQYLPQDELDRALEHERDSLASSLYLITRDFSDQDKQAEILPTLHHILEMRGTAPEHEARIAQLLAAPDTLKAITNEWFTFTLAYEQNHDLLRFHNYRPKELLTQLQELAREPVTFDAAEGFAPQRQYFISDDEISKLLRGDEQDSDYRLTICSYFLKHGDLADRVKCLQHYNGKNSGQIRTNEQIDFTSKGVAFSHGSVSVPYAKVELKWSEAAKRIGQMITFNVFLSNADRAAIPAFERKQIARELRSFFLDAPQKLPRPFNEKSDWSDSILEIAQQLSDPEKLDDIYEMMCPVLEKTPVDDRYYRQRKSAMEHFIAYRDGTFSLFGEVKKPKKESERSEEPSEPVEVTVSAPVTADTNADLEQAKEFINAYWMEEFDQEADFSDLHHVDLAYSTTTDSRHAIEIFADLVSFNLVYAVDGKTVWESSCNSLSEMNEYLAILDFDKMTENAEDAFLQEQQEQEQMQDPPAQAPDLPTEEEQPKLRSIVIDLTPRDGQSSTESLIGRRLIMDDRTFEVESVSDFSGDVSLRDVTFEKDVGFPITRIEKIGTVRRLLEQAEKEVPPEKKNTLAPPAPRRKKAAPFALHPEIPAAQRSNYRITDDHFAEGGAKTKFQNNITAIRTLQQIEAENRLATPEEQEILARYVGWGGLAQAFDENNDAWAKEAAELRALMPDAEYRAARATTLNAHYTSPTVIKAIYKVIESTGFRSGNVLEPSCGIGNFFGLVPESMAGAKLYGVELDSVTGRIAQQLYQHNRIAVQGYESADLPDNFFDLAVGNVPFGGYSLHDRRYDKHKFLIHDYFFAKTLDKVRPGGIIAFVTSKGTMDKKDSSVRRYLAQRAELIGAIRLPNNAFLANAGTQVTTDILFLQKREKMIEANPEWLHLGKTENGVPINQYFLSHPEMVLGEMVFDKSMYGNKDETSCHPFENADLAELLDKAIQNIHAEYTPFEAAEIEAEEDEAIPADPSVRNFSYTDVGGTLYYRENSLMFPVKQSLTGKSRIRGMLAIRDSVRRLIACQTENATEQEITQEQKQLNQLYDAFTAKYGLLNSRANNTAFSADSSYPLLCALEILDENGNLKRKADMFSKRTIQPYVSVDRVDTASEALAVSISEKARVDLRFMASLMDGAGGKDETIEHIKRDLAGVIFRDPDSGAGDSLSGWQTADEYLSGRVKEKLARAKLAAAQDPAYSVNVTALERVQPKDLTAGEISVRLGTTWIPTAIIDQFIYALLGTPFTLQAHIKVSYSKVSGEWYISEKSRDRSNVRAYNTYGTKRINAYKIIEQSLNLRDVRIFDTIQTEKGERRVLNKKETAIAQDKQDAIRQKFKDWIWQDPKRREYLCRFYNDRFNSVRPREYDGQHIQFVGMNPGITLRPHQRNAVARALYGGNALFGHVVGAGKSYEMIATAMEAKRLGLSSKSMFVVPNNIIGDFAADCLKLYPSANILVTTKQDFEKQNRKKFCARIATGDYDGVIISHSQFEKIPLSPERQIAMLERQINELIQGIADMKAEEGSQFSIKQMEKSRKNLEAKLKKLV